MITEIIVSHYKSIYDEIINFSRTNILVGKNGSGKSNLVDALSFLSDIVNEDLDYAVTKRHGADSIRQWSKFKPFNISICAKMSNKKGSGLYKIVIASSRNSYRVIEEVVEWNGETTFSNDRFLTVIRRNKSGSIDFETTCDDSDIDWDRLREAKIDPINAFITRGSRAISGHYWLFGNVISELRSLSTFNIFPNTIRAPQSVSNSRALESDGRNIASIIKQMTPERRRRIVKALRVVMPQLFSINVKSTAGYYVPVFSVSDNGSKETHELNMSQVSDGTLRILGMLAALYQPLTPSKVILEEPEQMIHPALLIVVRDAIEDYVNRLEDGQVFVTTHSADLMELFNIDNITAVEYKGGLTKIGPISDRQKRLVKDGLMTLGDVLMAEGLEIA